MIYQHWCRRGVGGCRVHVGSHDPVSTPVHLLKCIFSSPYTIHTPIVVSYLAVLVHLLQCLEHYNTVTENATGL